MVPGPSRSQMACSAAGSAQVANPLDSSVNPIPARGGLAFGPLVAVEPHLDRVREVGADLDERRPEIGVPEVEIETRHPPVGLGERKPRNPVVARAFRRGEHVLELLRDPDRGHPAAAGARLPSQIRPHHLDLAVVLTEPHHRDVVVGGETVHRRAERGADLLHDRRRRDRIAQMRGHKRHHLPAHLQVRHIAVQIDPIQALHIQAHMPVKHIVYRHRRSHDRQPGRPSRS